jgi:hypothetical protein
MRRDGSATLLAVASTADRRWRLIPILPHRIDEERTMLSTALIMEVRRELDRGELSHREISRRLGVSRGIIAAMAKGERGDHGRDPDQENFRSSPRRPLTSLVRCPECGGLVYAPCRLCAARACRERTLEIRRLLRERTPPRRAA